MTEQQFQETRKVMQRANHLRGLITAAKGEVSKWTAMEDANRRNLKDGQANGCKKQAEKWIGILEERRKKFADIKLPGEDFKPGTKWIAAFDMDSYNYMPKEIGPSDFEETIKEGHILFDTKQYCQNACDNYNKQ